jgi:hypothetical protein
VKNISGGTLLESSVVQFMFRLNRMPANRRLSPRFVFVRILLIGYVCKLAFAGFLSSLMLIFMNFFCLLSALKHEKNVKIDMHVLPASNDSIVSLFPLKLCMKVDPAINIFLNIA